MSDAYWYRMKPDVLGNITHLIWAVESGHGLRQTQHALQLPHGDPPGWFVGSTSIPLPQTLVLVHHELLSLWGDLQMQGYEVNYHLYLESLINICVIPNLYDFILNV